MFRFGLQTDRFSPAAAAAPLRHCARLSAIKVLSQGGGRSDCRAVDDRLDSVMLQSLPRMLLYPSRPSICQYTDSSRCQKRTVPLLIMSAAWIEAQAPKTYAGLTNRTSRSCGGIGYVCTDMTHQPARRLSRRHIYMWLSSPTKLPTENLTGRGSQSHALAATGAGRRELVTVC